MSIPASKIILIIVTSVVLTLLSAFIGGFPLKFLEPVVCIQVVGAKCLPFSVNFANLGIDLAFWASLVFLLGAMKKAFYK